MQRRRFLPLLLVLIAVCGWQPAQAAGVFYPESFTLENGMQVVVIEDHRAPVVNHMVWYKVGAADEPPGKSGIAHFFEHLMFKGTPSVPSGEFSQIVARNGGRDNAFTSYDYTGYYQQIARDKLDLVMGMEADRMVNLVLDEQDFEAEKQVVIEERRQRVENSPSARLGEMRQATQYLAHPYGIPVIGWKHEIEALTIDDAISFYKTYYAPNNAILIVAGDVTVDAVRTLAEKHFGGIAAQTLPPRLRPQEPPQLAARSLTYKSADVRQPSWTRTYLAPSRTAGKREHAVPLRVLSQILGGSDTSRLGLALVREQQIAAAAGTYYNTINLDPGTFYVYASPRPGIELPAIEAAVEKVLATLIQDGVTEEEITRAKTRLLADTIYARDSLSAGPRVIGSALTSGISIEEVEAWPDRVRAVTADEILAAARLVFDPTRSVTSYLLPDSEAKN